MAYLLFSCLLLASVPVIRVAAITNGEFYDLLKDSIEGEVEQDIYSNSDYTPSEDDDDTLVLPGNVDDEVDLEYLAEKLIFDIVANGNVTHMDMPLRSGCRCHRYSCGCCIRKSWSIRIIFKTFRARLHACIKLEYLRRDFGFRLSFTVNGRRLFYHEISLRRPPRLCYGIPGISLARVCVGIYNVNLRQKRVCFRLTGELSLVFKRFRIHIHVGCFRIPILNAEWLQEIKQEEDSLVSDDVVREYEFDAAEIFQNI